MHAFTMRVLHYDDGNQVVMCVMARCNSCSFKAPSGERAALICCAQQVAVHKLLSGDGIFKVVNQCCAYNMHHMI